MRYLAVDLGEKRTGLAVGDDVSKMVSPMKVIEGSRGDLLDAVREAAEDADADAIVIGLPINMDGTEGPAAKQTRVFGNELAQATNLPVHFQDERLTSYAADQRMARTGRTHKQKKSIRDALAAAEILRDFLDAQT
jgi:putative Holliday junction resolvase